MNDIIQLLKILRIKQGLTQSLLGEKLGLPQSHISKIEKGEADPRLSTLTDMARVLDAELVIIPRELVSVVLSMAKGDTDSQKPMWSLDEEDKS